MLEPAAALACAVDALEREGFLAAESSPDERSVVMLRAPRPSAAGPGEWWRVELAASRLGDEPTVISSLAGAAPRAEGPYVGPPPELQHLVGTLPSRCTWQPGA
jgi:hypothetical protein